MRNYQGLQTKLETIGKTGCYFLSILANFAYDGDIILFYDYCVEKGWIEEDCTVMNPEKIAYLLSGGHNYIVTKETDKPLKDKCDFYIECWKNDRTGYTHFKNPKIDTLKSSVTVKEGRIVSYRVFTRVD